MSDAPTFAVSVVCESEYCPNWNKEINLVRGLSLADAELLLESFGHGGEESDADHCPCCGKLGVAREPEVWVDFEDEAYDRGRAAYEDGSFNPFERDMDTRHWEAWERGYQSKELCQDAGDFPDPLSFLDQPERVVAVSGEQIMRIVRFLAREFSDSRSCDPERIYREIARQIGQFEECKSRAPSDRERRRS